MKSLRLDANKISGRIDSTRVDATTEKDISEQIAADERQSMEDAALYTRRIRHKLGYTQDEFAKKIHVSLETLRNWEQGKRRPTGPAQALLLILDKEPEAALNALR